MQKGMPIPYMNVERLSEVRRQVFCQNYDACLDHAILKRWKGFSCERCSSFEIEELTSEQWNDDETRCLRLMFSQDPPDPGTWH